MRSWKSMTSLYKWLQCIHNQYSKIHQQMLHVYKSHVFFQAAIKCSVWITKKASVKVLLANKEEKKKGVLHKPERKSFAYRTVSCLSSGFLLLCRFWGLVPLGFFCRKSKNERSSSSSTCLLIPVCIIKRQWLCCVGAATLFCLAAASVGFCGTCVTGGFWEMLSFIGFSSLG